MWKDDLSNGGERSFFEKSKSAEESRSRSHSLSMEEDTGEVLAEPFPVYDVRAFSRPRQSGDNQLPSVPTLMASGNLQQAHATEVRNDSTNIFMRALYKRLLAERERAQAAKRKKGTPNSIVSSIKRHKLDFDKEDELKPRLLVDEEAGRSLW